MGTGLILRAAYVKWFSSVEPHTETGSVSETDLPEAVYLLKDNYGYAGIAFAELAQAEILNIIQPF